MSAASVIKETVVHKSDTWKLRILLFAGLSVLLLDAVNEQILGLTVPRVLSVYLTIASGYFALDPQRRIEKCRENVVLMMLFPGAFVTAMLPFYSLIFFALINNW
jgi:hypothetical protein